MRWGPENFGPKKDLEFRDPFVIARVRCAYRSSLQSAQIYPHHPQQPLLIMCGTIGPLYDWYSVCRVKKSMIDPPLSFDGYSDSKLFIP